MRRFFFLLGLGLVGLVVYGLWQARPGPAASVPTTPELEENGAALQGRALFVGKGRCSSCHALTPGTVLVGPSLAGIGTVAATRVPGQSAPEYLLLAIVKPDAYKPPGFENKQMDSSLAKLLSGAEVDALIAYLLALR